MTTVLSGLGFHDIIKSIHLCRGEGFHLGTHLPDRFVSILPNLKERECFNYHTSKINRVKKAAIGN